MYITKCSHVISNRAGISMSANDHQGTDSRMCINVDGALNGGVTIVLVRTVDTDVVVILVGIFHNLAQHYPGMQLWVGLGKRKHFLYYRVNSIC